MGVDNKLHGNQTMRTTRQDTRGNWAHRLFVALALLGLSLGTALAADNSGKTLDFIDFKKLPDNGVEIRLALSANSPKPVDFTSNNPARISLDLPGVTNNLPWSLPLPVEAGVAKNVRAVQEKGRTRVIVNMDKMATYTIRTEGKNLYLTLAGDTAGKPATTAEEQPKAEPAQPPATEAKPEPAVASEPEVKKPAPARNVASLKDIAFTSLPGDRLQVRLAFDRTAVKPGSFTIDNPARIVLDFPHTASGLSWKNKNIGIGFAKSVTAVEAGDRTRVILNLVQLIPFETTVAGDNVTLTLAGSRTTQVAEAMPKGAVGAAAAATGGAPGAHRIKGIDFRRGTQGEGRIIISLSDPNTPVSTGETGRQIFVEFADTSLPKKLQQRLDVIDFATPVQYIDATQSGDKVRLTITPTGDYEYLAYHSGNSYTVEVKETPKKKQEAAKKDTFGYTGEKLSLNFQDIEVRAVLQLIADFTGLNMVTSDSVRGNLTLRLKNVPWDQALDIILKTKGLAMRKSGNVILVAPSQEIAAQEKLELAAQKQIEELAPLKSEIVQINYAKAKDVAKLLTSKGGLLSTRGTVSVDERTNTLLLADTADRLTEIRKLVNKLDVPIRQVMIESRIVIADDNFAKDLGVRFGATKVKERGNDLIFGSGSLESTDTMASSAMDNLANNGNPYPISVPTGVGGIPQRMNVNMPVVGANAGRIAFSILSSSTLLDLELSALQAEGRGEIVSNPRVITSNQKEAFIEQGTEIPYLQSSSSGAANVAFKKAVLSLKVTPQITPDDRIILDLAVNKDGVGQIFSGIPSIDTKEVQTQVLMDNGETVVLGGVYEQTNRNDSERVPFFGDLPFIGALFRTTRERNDKSELLIFVTPKILKQELTTQ
jgi:type IV pilus assembly protein PilQ